MTTLSSIVQVTITSDGRGVSRKGFGVPLVIAKHSNFAESFKEYTQATVGPDMIVDGFTVNDPAYRAATAVARNTPKGQKILIGKLLTDFDQTFDITVQTTVALGGELYAFNIVGPTGVVTAISYTAIAADTETVIAAALETQIDAIADITSVPTAGVIAVTADVANEMFLVKGLDVNILEFLDTTVDSSLVTELTAIQTLNSDWYGLILADPQSNARITALAAYIETQEAIFMATTADTEVGDSVSTTDVMFLANAAQYFRTAILYSGDQGTHAAATWMGNGFPFDPGSQTWAFKPLSGVIFDVLPSGFMSAIAAKKGNYYVSIAGAPVTQKDGVMASGEFIDVIRGRDWLTSRLRERIFGLLINARKVPFTNAGIDQVVSEVSAQLSEGIGAGYLSPDSLEGTDVPFIVTAPTAQEVSSANKIARLLPDVAFEATLAGAIHAVQVNGSISV